MEHETTSALEPADAEPPSSQAARRAPSSSSRLRFLSPAAPLVEEIAAEGLRWVKIDHPGPARAGLARGELRLPRPRLRGRPLAQPAPEDRPVRGLPLHRPALPGLRQLPRAPRHRRARHLRGAGLPDHDPEPAAAAGRVPVRALPLQGGAPRPALLARLRLPALPARRRRLRLLLPDAAQDREQARCARGGDLRGERVRGDRARHLQRQAGDHQLPQGDPPAATRAPRPGAGEGALPRSGDGPRDLLRRHRRRPRADLGHARELQGGRRGPRGHERVGDRATASTTSSASSPRSASSSSRSPSSPASGA